ncbi:MAG: alpha/beta hydrolase [Euryarchaeota archaeon]|nr:alpha/beta hydrolase [Euryarchaeota archaeon]
MSDMSDMSDKCLINATYITVVYYSAGQDTNLYPPQYETTAMERTGVFQTGDGSPLQYIICGEGPVIVFVHGYGMTMEEWPSRMISMLASSFTVVRFNLRGVAGNANTDNPFTIPLAAEDLYELVNELVTGIAGIAEITEGPVTIVGFSMGGMIAQEFAIRHPELTDRLVLINTHCGGIKAIPPRQWVIEEMASTPATMEEYIMRAGRLLLPEKWRKKHPDPMSWFPDFGEPSNQEAIKDQFDAMSSWEGTFSLLHQITTPVLVISGERERHCNTALKQLHPDFTDRRRTLSHPEWRRARADLPVSGEGGGYYQAVY